MGGASRQRALTSMVMLLSWYCGITLAYPHLMGGLRAQIEKAIEDQEGMDTARAGSTDVRLGSDDDSSPGLADEVTSVGADDDDAPDVPCEMLVDDQYPCVRKHLHKVVVETLDPTKGDGDSNMTQLAIESHMLRKEANQKARERPQNEPSSKWTRERLEKKPAMKVEFKAQDRQFKALKRKLLRAVRAYHTAATTKIQRSGALEDLGLSMKSEVKETRAQKRRRDRLTIEVNKAKQNMASSLKEMTSVNKTLNIFHDQMYKIRATKLKEFEAAEGKHPPRWLREAQDGVRRDKENKPPEPKDPFIEKLNAQIKNETLATQNDTIDDMKIREYEAFQRSTDQLKMEVNRQQQMVRGMQMFDRENKFYLQQRVTLDALKHEEHVEADHEKHSEKEYKAIEKQRSGSIKSDLESVQNSLGEIVGEHGDSFDHPLWFRNLVHEAEASAPQNISLAAAQNMALAQLSDAKVQAIRERGFDDRDTIEAENLGTSNKNEYTEIRNRYSTRLAFNQTESEQMP